MEGNSIIMLYVSIYVSMVYRGNTTSAQNPSHGIYMCTVCGSMCLNHCRQVDTTTVQL